jgi:hypothetical protein
MRFKKILAVNGAIIVVLVIAILSFHNWNTGKQVKENQTTTEEVTTSVDINAKMKADIENTEETATEFSIKNTDITDETKTSINTLVKKYYTNYGEENADILMENTKEETKESQKSKDLDQKKREIIENYKNLKTYVKPGLENDTYVVFTTYNIKFNNIDTLAPGMSVLYVVKDASGKFLISDNLEDDKLNDYIASLSSEQDIKDVIDTINTKLENAIKKDKSLKKFMDYLS